MKDRIAELRKIKNLSQEAFSQKVGISRNYLSLLETGARVPSDRTISDICRVFHVSPEWLRSGTGDMFVDVDEDFFDVMSQVYGLTEDDVQILRIFCNLPETSRAALIEFVNALAEAQTKKDRD